MRINEGSVISTQEENPNEFVATLPKIKTENIELPPEDYENEPVLASTSTSIIKKENGIISAVVKVKNGVKGKNDVASPVKTRSKTRAIKSEHLSRHTCCLRNLVPNPAYQLRSKSNQDEVKVKVEVDEEVEPPRRSTRCKSSSAPVNKESGERKQSIPANSRAQNGNGICVKVENGSSTSLLRRRWGKDHSSGSYAKKVSQMARKMSSAALAVLGGKRRRRATIDTAAVPPPPLQATTKPPPPTKACENSRAKSFTAAGNNGQYMTRACKKVKLESNGITSPPEDVKPDIAKLRKRDLPKSVSPNGGLYLYHSARQIRMYLPRPTRSRSGIVNVSSRSSFSGTREQTEEAENTSGLDPNIVKTEPDEEVIEVKKESGLEVEEIGVSVELQNVTLKTEQETVVEEELLQLNEKSENSCIKGEEESSVPVEIKPEVEVTPDDEVGIALCKTETEGIFQKLINGENKILSKTSTELNHSSRANGDVDNARKRKTKRSIKVALKTIRKARIPNQERKNLKKFIGKASVKRKKLSESEITIPSQEIIPIIPEIKIPSEKINPTDTETIKKEKELEVHYCVPNYSDEEKKRLYGNKQFLMDIHDVQKDPSRIFIWQIIEDGHRLRKYSPCRFGPQQFFHTTPQYWYFHKEDFRSEEFYKRFQPLVVNIAKLEVHFGKLKSGWEVEECIVQYPFVDKEFFFRMAENMGQIHKTEYLRYDLMKCMPLMILQNFNSSVLPNLLRCAETNPESIEDPNLLSYVNSWNTVRQVVNEILLEAENSRKCLFDEDTFKTLRIFPSMYFLPFRNTKSEPFCSICFPTYQRKPVVRVSFMSKFAHGPKPYDPKTLQDLPEGPLANPKKATDWCEYCSEAAKKYHRLAHFCYNLRRLLKQNMAADLAIFKAKQIPITDKFVLWMHDVDVNWRYTRFLDFQLSVAEVEAAFQNST